MDRMETTATGIARKGTRPNDGLVDWLLSCPQKDYFVAIESELTEIVLDPEDAGRFLAALDNPSSFAPGLRALAEQPSVLED